MRSKYQLRVTTLVVSFASIVYEFCLSHVMAILYGGVVSRYILTTGLFIFFLGIGALYFDKFLKDSKKFKLFKLELLLSLIGFVSVLLPFVFDALFPNIAMSLSWSLICVVAFFSGIELPALMSYSGEKLNILAFDYLGMCLGGVFFTMLFLPQIGILNTSFTIATLNLIIAHMIFLKEKHRYSFLFCFLYLIPLLFAVNSGLILSYIEGVFIAS